MAQVQPNYQRLAGAFATASEECTQLAATPVLQSGEAIIAAINGLREELRLTREELQREIREARDDLNARLDANDNNTIARLFNSTVDDPYAELRPLRNHHNMPVPNFPRNGAAITNLSRAEITTLLREFRVSSDGDLDEKRRRFGFHIGIVMRAL